MDIIGFLGRPVVKYVGMPSVVLVLLCFGIAWPLGYLAPIGDALKDYAILTMIWLVSNLMEIIAVMIGVIALLLVIKWVQWRNLSAQLSRLLPKKRSQRG